MEGNTTSPGEVRNDERVYCDDASRTPKAHHAYLLPPVLRMLRAAEARTLLDVCCGDGRFSQSLSEAGFSVYGCDISKSGIAIAQKQGPERFRVASAYDDLTSLFPDRRHFDAVVVVEAIEHLYAPRDLLRRAHEALVPGGRLILTTPYHGYIKNLALAASGKMDAHFCAKWDGGHIKFWSRRTLSELLREQGFESITFEGAGRVPFLWNSMVMSGSTRTA